MSPREALEGRLGHRFSRPALLEQALTHRSASAPHNERLEFLGDGVLGCAIAEALFARFPDLPEGQLTRLRASLVREESLVEVAGELALAGLLRRDEREPPRPSMLADAVEALVGAVFVDGGYAPARETVLRCFAAKLEALDPRHVHKDAKTHLQELLQAQGKPLPEYRVVATHGADHNRSFEVECVVARLSARGQGTSRQRAEQQAAQAMLELLA
ncbi:MAG TPA: ribonuclease III [Burkholderiales bacterium]|nr:ribonuclease III [Burkholderiales bacterium]